MSDVRHMMIDLETFGVGERAFIAQLGFAVFDPYELGPVKQSCGWNLDGESVKAAGGEMDADTVLWWLEPERQAAAATLQGKYRISLREALGILAYTYRSHKCERIWSHGAVFDCAIINGYCRRLGIEPPWRFKERDTRTLYDVAELMGWTRARGDVAHTAEADAVAQAADVQGAFKYIQSIGYDAGMYRSLVQPLA